MSFACDGAETRVSRTLCLSRTSQSHKKQVYANQHFLKAMYCFLRDNGFCFQENLGFLENMRTFFDDVHSFLVGPMLFKETVALV